MPPDIVVQTKAKYEEGTATVTSSGQGCPVAYLGTSRSAQAKGCGHSVCTTAKGLATNDLVNALSGTNGAGCANGFISSTGRCKKGPGCLSLYYEPETYEGENGLHIVVYEQYIEGQSGKV